MKKSIIENLLGISLKTGGDFSEVFIENRISNLMSSTGDRIDDILSGEECGIGIRAFKDLDSVYVYTNDFSESNLISVASEAAKALSLHETGSRQTVLDRVKRGKGHIIKIDPVRYPKQEKAYILKEMYREAKACGTGISQVQGSIADYKQDVTIANSDGRYIKDSRTRCRFSVSCVASDGNLMNSGYFAPGAHKGSEFFTETDYRAYAREAARIALTMLKAKECPGGVMPVIIENGFGGVIFHEACGHGLEATFIAKKTSVFADSLGKQVASGIVTAIDDGTIGNEWGSANYDDEGTGTQKNVLIENGILKNFLVDKLNARRMGAKENGSSRRQSYRQAPTSRMSNTYIACGGSSLDDMIRSTDRGLYAKNMGGGSVNPATGEFNFSVLEGYLIEDGRITVPVRGASLIGRGQDILFAIEMTGNDLAFGQGMCGSESGLVPVNVGQPAIKIREIVVGGRN
jgi:TldD protein